MKKDADYIGKDLEAMSFAKNYHAWIMDQFRPYLGESVAEVGAGRGNFSKLILREKITSLQSFEPSSSMYPLLQSAIGPDPRAVAVNDFFGGSDSTERFDSVFYINVLEHIEDDVVEIGRVFRSLTRNGHFMLFVPALPSLYSEFDKSIGHFRRYRKKPLLRMIEDAGFDVVKIRYFDIAGILPWYVSMVLLKGSMKPGAVALYDKIVVPAATIFESWIAPPIGKNLLVVGKKT